MYNCDPYTLGMPVEEWFAAERRKEREYLTMDENSNTTAGDWDYSGWGHWPEPVKTEPKKDCCCGFRYCPHCGHPLPYPYAPYPHPWIWPWTPYVPYWSNVTYTSTTTNAPLHPR